MPGCRVVVALGGLAVVVALEVLVDLAVICVVCSVCTCSHQKYNTLSSEEYDNDILVT